VDDDLGFGVIRMTRDDPWKPEHLAEPLRNMLLASSFEWGMACTASTLSVIGWHPMRQR